jgi:hypothetical protein
VQWHDDAIGVASCLMSLVVAVREGGRPVRLPRYPASQAV